MLSLEERRNRQQFWAFLCYDTIEDSYLRVKQLLDTGRPIIHIERWLEYGELSVTTGVRVWNEGYRPGVYFEKNEEWAQFSLTLDPVTFGFGYSAYSREGDESEHAKRFHAMNRQRGEGRINYFQEAARIEVEGFGLGRNDCAIIRRFNEHGVGKETALYFQYEQSDARAEREAAILDALAERGDWTAEDLRKLAAQARFEWEPVAELINNNGKK